MPRVLTVSPFTSPYVQFETKRLAKRLTPVLAQFKGQEPSSETLKSAELAIKNILIDSYANVSTYSLDQGAKEVNVVVPPQTRLELTKFCNQRAADVAHQVISTTAVAFGVVYAALTPKMAVGKKRAKTIAKFETSRIFFESRRKGWGLRHGIKKQWYAADDPCELCQENEDEGPIPIDDAFPSGDYAPAAHPNCECLMSLIL